MRNDMDDFEGSPLICTTENVSGKKVARYEGLHMA